ncbi:putative mediator of RNA polymerase II transcription subunit 12 [Ischnura elegans]|uniref:putative mediator of RNA polymerase II transcription subunit 12 n=1 Tax=Ischnura elegans TaxID=197161 RepID=UPI001ED8BFD5|nr:putative mediator of RNA polymerase II transcription subunit 12 [Ischnura elegans]
MWPRILTGIILFVGVAVAVSEYDNIPLETSHAAQRSIGQRPFYTATYGVAPGEYVLRGSSDEGQAQPAATPLQSFSFIQRDQPPPQEYLDLLNQAGVAETGAAQQHHQQQQPQAQSAPSRVVQQQYFGVHNRAPYPAAGVQPVSSLQLPNSPTKYTQPERSQPEPPRAPVQSYPSAHNQVAPTKYDSTPLYVTPLPDTVPPKKTKPTPAPSARKTTAGRSQTRLQGDARHGSGKAVQQTYSLDYDLRTLHKDAGSAARTSPAVAPYSPSVPGKVVKGDEQLLRKLAPEPEPLPFPLSRRGSKKSKTKQPASSSDYDDDDDDQKVEVIKLPKNQRPITQEELNELIRAGYDVTPVEEDEEQAPQQPRQESIAPQKPQHHVSRAQGYPQPAAPQHQLRLPKSRPAEAHAPRYYTSTKTQEPTINIPTHSRQSAYPSAPASAAGDEDVGYTYHTPRPLPLQTFRQKPVEPKVQAYQPGRSGIQDVNKQKAAEQAYQEEDESQTQAYLNGYVYQGHPTPPEPQPPQSQSYPTAAAHVQYQQVPAEQPQHHHQQQVAQQELQAYHYPRPTESRHEVLSQPKEYELPAPQRPTGFHPIGRQAYVTTAPSAAGSDESQTYRQALVLNQQQGYEQGPTAAGVSAPASELPQSFPQTTEGYGRRITRRRPSSLRESRVTYIRRFPGQTTGYSSEQ